VNTKSFYVRSAVGRERHPVGAWPRWLADRMSSGELFIDGHPASKPGWLPSATAGQVQAPKPVDPEARELRFLRAANEVLKHYERERRDNARTAEIHVRGGSRDYLVTAQTDWSRPPRCTCPDATHSTHLHNGYCKHVVAVLLENEDLRGQLIEIFL